MRQYFFLADSHANVPAGFATAVTNAGGTCVAKQPPRSTPAELTRAAGQLVEASWPDDAESVTSFWETLRKSHIIVDP